MINIVVPMAGRGLRLVAAEEHVPKPLIQVVPGRTMIDYVIDYLTLSEPHRFIFVCLRAHDRVHNFREFFRGKADDYKIVIAEKLTRGPAASALLAEAFIDDDDELFVAYCDMFLTIDMADFLQWSRMHGADAAVFTYPSASPMDSYAEIDDGGRVIRTAEKVVISDTAPAGLYYFRRGLDFVAAARATMRSNPNPADEIFVNPCYNELIGRGKSVLAYPVGREQKIEMGTPSDLQWSRAWLTGHPRPTARRIAPTL